MACAKKQCSATTGLSTEQQAILAAMAANSTPQACKEIAAAAGLDGKVVSCKLKSLKTLGYVDSPARCKYAITEAGKKATATA